MRTRAGLVSTTIGALAIGISAIMASGHPASATPESPSTTEDTDEAEPTAVTTSDAPTTVAETTTTFLDPYGNAAPIGDLVAPSRPGSTFQTREPPPPPTTTTTTLPPVTAPPPWQLPAGSGEGRRAVYSKSLQRVWAVDASGVVIKTHRVSGKLKWCDPSPGWYSVFSRSRYTFAIQNPTIKWGYMVRFTRGCNGGNIGFHEIPSQYGRAVQSISQLGQPLSGGCVRQAPSDAIWMWNWAGIGTRVVVTP